VRPVIPIFFLLLILGTLGSGCVRRVVDITTEPDGALVWMNGREVGTTPVEVEIVYYGDYDVQVVRDGYETLSTSAKANPPVWDMPGLDLVSEVLPADLESRTTWHFELVPEDQDDADVMKRAEALRARLTDDLDKTKKTPDTDG
jgi:hypothetical protein